MRDRRYDVKSGKICLPAIVALMFLCFTGCIEQKSGASPNPIATADQIAPAKTDSDSPPVLKLRGVLRDHDGKRLGGVVGVLFAVYEQQQGGAPLWQEVQNIQVDTQGHFTALVGSTKREGISPELFGPQETLWLGNQVLLPGEVEQSRIMLVSTPHGLVAERGSGSVIPANSRGSQLAAATSQATEATAESPQDTSVSRPSRSRLRLHPRRPTP